MYALSMTISRVSHFHTELTFISWDHDYTKLLYYHFITITQS